MLATRSARREPDLSACSAPLVQGVLLLGPRAGQRLLRLFGRAAAGHTDAETEAEPQVWIGGNGFDGHARIGMGRLTRNPAGR